MLSMSQLQGFNVGGEHDPYWDYVELLFHFNSDFVDSKYGRTLTPVNVSDPATISGSSRFGAGSAYMDGSYGSMSYDGTLANIGPGSLDFTLEGFIYINGMPTTAANIFGINGSTGVNLAGWGNGSSYELHVKFGGYIQMSIDATGYVNNWIHVVIQRQGSKTYLYINGVTKFTYNTDIGTLSCAVFEIGYNNSSQCFNGYIDEVRYTKGVAIYPITANYVTAFTPPTAPFPNS